FRLLSLLCFSYSSSTPSYTLSLHDALPIYLILVLAFLIFTITGLAVGTSLRRWPQLLTQGLSAAAALALLIAVTIYMGWTAYQRAEHRVVVCPIMREFSQRFTLVLVVGAAPVIAGWWAIRRSLRNPWA